MQQPQVVAARPDPLAGSTAWRNVAAAHLKPQTLQGLDKLWSGIAGRVNSLIPRRRLFLAEARRIVRDSETLTHTREAALREELADLRDVFRRGRADRTRVARALALLREAAWRTVGLKPFTVQIAAALALWKGCLVELATGEGKTLSASLAGVLGGWRGRGCHVVTVNDYLAKRDADQLRPLYHLAGVTVGLVQQESDPSARKQAYLADVTYLTNKEVSADYLRDRLAMGRMGHLPRMLVDSLMGQMGGGTDRVVQRGLDTAIIDEADSILIDEAVTPLIISGEGPNSHQIDAFVKAADVATELVEKTHYTLDRRYREVSFTKAGRRCLEERLAGEGGIWAGPRRREELMNQAVVARHFFLKGEQYIVDDEGKVVIVDELTGRTMPDRTWRDGLHQAVEAKEKLEIQPIKITLARISFQRFFRLYRKLSGMTGTAWEARREFWSIYRLPVVPIPTNKPCIRRQWPDILTPTHDRKWQRIADRVGELHAAGRPVLIGTRSIEASEHLSKLLAERSLPHEVLNAVRHEQEAQVVAKAGEAGAITVATNMAGRGTDIRPAVEVLARGGLHVISAERNDTRRIDRQLFGRTGRQGDPGTAEAILSLEDELFKRYARGWLRRSGLLWSRGPWAGWLTAWMIHSAQARAGRIMRRQREGVLKQDDWLNEYLGFAHQES